VRCRNAALLPTIADLPRRLGVLPADRLTVDGAVVRAAVRVRAGADDEVLEVRGDAVLLPDGIPGEGEVHVRLFLDGSATAVTLTSRTGGTVTGGR
jgi:hypothetical protein